MPLRQVDGAVQWDGVHFYEYGLAHPRDRVARRPGDVWWLYVVAPMIDPVYVVAASPRPRRGYVVHATRPYDSWIRSDEEAQVYVWRRRSARPTIGPVLKSIVPVDSTSAIRQPRAPYADRSVESDGSPRDEPPPTAEAGGPR